MMTSKFSNLFFQKERVGHKRSIMTVVDQDIDRNSMGDIEASSRFNIDHHIISSLCPHYRNPFAFTVKLICQNFLKKTEQIFKNQKQLFKIKKKIFQRSKNNSKKFQKLKNSQEKIFEN